MASEDSDHFGSGFLPVHRLDHLEQICQTMVSEVISTCNPLHAEGKFLEVETLRSSQRVLPEKRDHNPKQVGTPANVERQEVLTVIVVSGVSVHRADTQEHSQVLQALRAALALCHYEVVGQLKAGLVAASVRTIRLTHDSD